MHVPSVREWMDECGLGWRNRIALSRTKASAGGDRKFERDYVIASVMGCLALLLLSSRLPTFFNMRLKQERTMSC